MQHNGTRAREKTGQVACRTESALFAVSMVSHRLHVSPILPLTFDRTTDRYGYLLRRCYQGPKPKTAAGADDLIKSPSSCY